MTFSDNFSGAYVGNYNVSSLIEIVPEPFYWKKTVFCFVIYQKPWYTALTGHSVYKKSSSVW